MTDKTPQNKAENPVNIPTTLVGTMDTARDGELKSRTLPQADALKARFKEGSIPLQTDFADLIDMANIGRKAIGDEGTAWGLTQDKKGRLLLDTSHVFNTVVDLSSSGARISLPNNILGEDRSTFNYALVAKNSSTGPVDVIENSDIDFTVFNVRALQRKGGNSQYVTLKVIGRKRSGINLEDYPLEMVKNKESGEWSLYCQFSLDSSSEDYSNSLLFIAPLALEVRYVPDYSNDSVGEVVGMLNIHFQYATAAGKGMKRSDSGQLELNAGSGLNVNGSGISVIVGNGIAVNSSGVNVKLAKGANTNGGEGHGSDGATSGSGGGLILTANGLSVDAGNGIQINQQGVSIKLAANSGLSADEMNGLKVVPEQQFQKGMIMMFSGKEAPKGWALCDGSSGTPNLLDRFILGGKFGDVNQKNSTTLSGNSNDKKFSITTDKSKADINVKVESHKLTINEMPRHSHGGVDSIRWVSGGGNMSDGSNNKINENVSTGESGGGQAHNHGSTVTQTSHSHSASIMPPYYTLAFIMKL